jgi:hypothetical protein
VLGSVVELGLEAFRFSRSVEVFACLVIDPLLIVVICVEVVAIWGRIVVVKNMSEDIHI